MNWSSIKKPADLKLDGVTFECEYRDKVLSAVTATDKSGNAIRFVQENYNFHAMIPAAPEKKTVHVVKGTVREIGTEIREEFDELYAANGRRSEIEQADVCKDVTVTTEEVVIPF